MDYENRIQTLEKNQEKNYTEHKEILDRLNEKDIADAVMREQLDTVVKTTNRIEQKIDEQNKVPISRWNNVVNSLVTGSIGAIIGTMIGFIVKTK